VFHLGDGVFHASLRDQTEQSNGQAPPSSIPRPTSRCKLAQTLCKLGRLYAAPEVRSLAAGIQHFRLNTVDVLFMAISARPSRIRGFRRIVRRTDRRATLRLHEPLDHDAPSLDNVSVAAAGQAQAARRAILIFLRHAVDPSIGRDSNENQPKILDSVWPCDLSFLHEKIFKPRNRINDATGFPMSRAQ